MANTIPQTIESQPKISRRAQDRLPETSKRRPHRVLVVVDGSERTGRVVEQAKTLASDERSIQAIVLNVQPAPVDGRLRGYGSFKRKEIKEHLVDCLGRRAVTAAGRVLSHAGIESTFRVEIGDAVGTILRIADEESCDVILIGSAAPTALQKWLHRTTGLLMATTATQVAQLSAVPVIVVK